MIKITNLDKRQVLQIYLIYSLVFIGSSLFASSFILKDLKALLAVIGLFSIIVGCFIAGIMFKGVIENSDFIPKYNGATPLQETECIELLYQWFFENRALISITEENAEQSIKVILLENYEGIVRNKAPKGVVYGDLQKTIRKAAQRIYTKETEGLTKKA